MAQLFCLMDMKPPISRAKMIAITKSAIKAIKLYKHVVQIVEKFIKKCKPEYKVPGLYVVDSIVRQSRHQFGQDKDVFGPRFIKNLTGTFQNLYLCPTEDKSKIVRVLNLWQKNGVFKIEIIQPLLDMAAGTSTSAAVPELDNDTSIPEPPLVTTNSVPIVPQLPNSDAFAAVAQLFQSTQGQQLQQILQTFQQPPKPQSPAPDNTVLTQVQAITAQLKAPVSQTSEQKAAFDKKLLDRFDYDDEPEGGEDAKKDDSTPFPASQSFGFPEGMQHPVYQQLSGQMSNMEHFQQHMLGMPQEPPHHQVPGVQPMQAVGALQPPSFPSHMGIPPPGFPPGVPPPPPFMRPGFNPLQMPPGALVNSSENKFEYLWLLIQGASVMGLLGGFLPPGAMPPMGSGAPLLPNPVTNIQTCGPGGPGGAGGPRGPEGPEDRDGRQFRNDRQGFPPGRERDQERFGRRPFGGGGRGEPEGRDRYSNRHDDYERPGGGRDRRDWGRSMEPDRNRDLEDRNRRSSGHRERDRDRDRNSRDGESRRDKDDNRGREKPEMADSESTDKYRDSNNTEEATDSIKELTIPDSESKVSEVAAEPAMESVNESAAEPMAEPTSSTELPEKPDEAQS
ncbi:UNVERIFIED_CONTAM: hypothetical protein FKN15_016355 [Acipenser sinensis]